MKANEAPQQYIPKSALVAEIERRIDDLYDFLPDASKVENGTITISEACNTGKYTALESFRKYIDTLEVKEVDTWHLQEKEDIYDVVKDWGPYTFACIMKDGTIQKFIGSMDEDCEGHIHVHIDGVNDDYDNVDDIIKWIEFKA